MNMLWIFWYLLHVLGQFWGCFSHRLTIWGQGRPVTFSAKNPTLGLQTSSNVVKRGSKTAQVCCTCRVQRCAGHPPLVRAHRATRYDARIDCNEVCNIAIETIRRPRTLRWRGLHRCRDPKNFMSFQNVKIWGFSFFLPISSFYAFFDFYPEMQSQRVSSARVPATDLDTGDTGTWKSRRRNHKSPLEGFGSSFALELL